MAAKKVREEQRMSPTMASVYEVTCDGGCGKVEESVGNDCPSKWGWEGGYSDRKVYCPDCYKTRIDEKERLEPERHRLYLIADEILYAFDVEHDYGSEQHEAPMDYDRLVILLDTVQRLMQSYPHELIEGPPKSNWDDLVD